MQSGVNQINPPARLFENLEQAVLLSQDLLAILGEEQKALAATDMQALVEICAKKENRLERLKALDAMIAEMAGSLRPESAPKTGLAWLVPLLGREEGGRLKELRNKLAGLRAEILKRNQVNRLFATDVRGYLNDAISLITSAIADRPLYGLSGLARKPSLNQPSLISREV